MKRFLKPLHHSIVFWYGVISLAFCLIWGNHLLHMESYNNAGGWMVWGLCLLFGGCMLVCVVVLNGVELTEDEFMIHHGLSLRPTIRIAYHKIAHIELQQRGPSQIHLHLTTTNGRRINRIVPLVRKTDRKALCHALQQKGVTCHLTR